MRVHGESDIVRVGLPSKGSLSEPMFAFLRECGLSIDRPSARSYSARFKNMEGLDVSFLWNRPPGFDVWVG